MLGTETDEELPHSSPLQAKATSTIKWLKSESLKAAKSAFSSVTSKESQKMAVSSVVFTSTIALLLVAAIIIYLLFYLSSMPVMGKSVQIYLDYSSKAPSALLDLRSNFDDTGLVMKAGQRYNLGIELVTPDTESNHLLGNFMVSLELFGKKNQTLGLVSRPAHLKYKSPMLRGFATSWNAISLIMDWSLESSITAVPLIRNYLESSSNLVQFVKITLNCPDIETYSSHLIVETHFQGLAYFMHHWWLSTALFFISNIMLAEILIASYIWSLVTDSLLDDSVPPKDSEETQESDLKSSGTTNENETLDGESSQEAEIFTTPNGNSTRSATPVRQLITQQAGNFSYPNKDYSGRDFDQMVVPDLDDKEDQGDLGQDSISSYHPEDTTAHDITFDNSVDFDLSMLGDDTILK